MREAACRQLRQPLADACVLPCVCTNARVHACMQQERPPTANTALPIPCMTKRISCFRDEMVVSLARPRRTSLVWLFTIPRRWLLRMASFSFSLFSPYSLFFQILCSPGSARSFQVSPTHAKKKKVVRQGPVPRPKTHHVSKIHYPTFGTVRDIKRTSPLSFYTKKEYWFLSFQRLIAGWTSLELFSWFVF